VSDRERRVSGETLPEDPEPAWIGALLDGPHEVPEMTPEQSERLDRRFYAMVEEQRREQARRRQAKVFAAAAVTVAVVGAGAGLVIGRRSSADAERAPAQALAKARARAPVSAAASASAPPDLGAVNGTGRPRR
jgi:hypothetical protein